MKLQMIAALVALASLSGCAEPVDSLTSELRRTPDPGEDPPAPEPPAPSTPPSGPAPTYLTFRVAKARCVRSSDSGGEDRDEVYFQVHSNINYNQSDFRIPALDDYYGLYQGWGWTDGYQVPWTNKDEAPVTGPIFVDRTPLYEGMHGQIEVKVMEQDSGAHDLLGTFYLTFNIHNGKVEPYISGSYPAVATYDFTNPARSFVSLYGTDSYYEMFVEVL